MKISENDYNRLMFDWAKERVTENMLWFQAKGTVMTHEQRELYRHAYMSGWADALHLACLHGFIEIKKREEN